MGDNEEPSIYIEHVPDIGAVVQLTPNSGSAPDPRLQLSHWRHQVAKEIRPVMDMPVSSYLLFLFVGSSDICK